MRKEIVSIDMKDVLDCIKKEVIKRYPLLKSKSVIDLVYTSKTTFLTFDVIRKGEDTEKNKKNCKTYDELLNE